MTFSTNFNGMSVGAFVPATVSTDPLSGKLVPANNTEWSIVYSMAGAGLSAFSPPTSIWLFQEASASAPADVNGLHSLPPVVAGQAFNSWQNPVSGWSRKAIGNAFHSGTDIGFGKQHGTLPDPATNSYMILAYVQLASVPAVDQGFLSLTDSAIYVSIKGATGKVATGTASGGAAAGNFALPIGSVFPVMLKHDIARNTVKVYVQNEVLTQVFVASAANTGEVDFGVALASTINTAPALYVYGAMWTGAGAEMSDEQVGALLQTLGWSVAWAGAPVADATSGKYTPLVKSQWTTLGLPTPCNVWPLQENIGIVYNDIINDCTLVGAPGTAAGNAITGWNRVGISVHDSFTNCYANSIDAKLPNPGSKSVALLMYTDVTAAVSGTANFWSWVGGFDSLDFASIECTTAGHLGMYQNGGFANPTGVFDVRGSVHPMLYVLNTKTSASTLYTDQEKIAGPTFVSDTNGPGMFVGGPGGGIVPAAGALTTFAVLFSGSNAEFTDNTARSLLQGLGWTVLW